MELLHTAWLFLCGFPAIIAVGILLAILSLVLTCDREKLKEVRRLKHVVKLANAGNENARLTCEHDSRIAKGIVYDEITKGIRAYYSVSTSSILHPFGFY